MQTCIGLLSPRLQELNLGAAVDCEGMMDMSPFLQFDYPALKSIKIRKCDWYHSAVDDNFYMLFWKRHPTLESINLEKDEGYFSEDVAGIPDFAPNLKHLSTPFKNVQSPMSLLRRLTSLSIYNALGTQVPYLFHTSLLEGLPYLKSLAILRVSAILHNDLEQIQMTSQRLVPKCPAAFT
ncbi:hypothetical protein FA15DRAFT_65445 [Coprinopsis marcescibilis]|uniref:F-box domain-containing protein n=1 Tax=Coprinopsis marcescibilis TaxID=230819 RepID=A0A5C3KPK8_COPMA|nr:hypothetical protein FA15DRAFT_65445 [Coprinopsis marcescibilis]